MKNLLTLLAPYNKAIVPIVVGAVLALLAGLGVTADMTVEEVLTMGFTAFLVWLGPNAKKK